MHEFLNRVVVQARYSNVEAKFSLNFFIKKEIFHSNNLQIKMQHISHLPGIPSLNEPIFAHNQSFLDKICLHINQLSIRTYF